MNNNIREIYSIGAVIWHTLIRFIEPYSLTGSFKTLSGDKIYFLNGELHREDGPAIEYAGGTKRWYFKGKQHREDGPAIEYAGGTKYWYLNGERHRVDGPAVEYANGNKLWYLNGNLHREDGPAIEFANGNEVGKVPIVPSTQKPNMDKCP